MNIKVWSIDSEKFMSHIMSLGVKSEFLKKFQKEKEKRLVNTLAKNLFNNLKGMNIDGLNNAEHKRYQES